MTKPTGLQYHLQILSSPEVWADVSPFVLYSNGVELNRGRQDQFATIQAGTLAATLDNTDGRFAPGNGYPLGTNYLTNPAFTVDTTSWTASASLTVAPPVDTVRLTANSTAALTFQATTATLPATAAGKTFTLSAQVNATGTVVGKTMSQKVEFYDISSVLISTITRPAAYTLLSTWNTVNYTMTVPAGAVTAKVFPVYVPAGWAVNDFVLLDNVMFTDSTDGRYFDGRQISWIDGVTYNTGSVPRDAQGFSRISAWNGLADASTSVLYRVGPYWPALNAECPIRVRFPDPNNNNMVATAEDASFEGGTIGTWLAYPGKGSVANSAVRAWDGTKSLMLTSSATGAWAYATVAPVTAGLTYTIQVRVWVPTGQPDTRLDLLGITVIQQITSLKNQWVTLTLTFTVPLNFTSNTILPVVAFDPVAAGQQVWIDGFHFWEGTAAPPAFVTGPNPNHQYKFKGYLSTLPVQWPGGQNYSEVAVIAGDRLASLGRRNCRSVVEEEILSDNPSVYYTLGEAAGSTTAGDTSGKGNLPLTVNQRGSGGTIAFGAGTGPPTDGLTAAVFTPASTNNHKWLSVRYTNSLAAFLADKTVICTFSHPTVSTDKTLWRVWDGSHWNTMNLNIEGSTGRLKLSWGNTGNLFSIGIGVDDGATHQAAIVFSGGAYPNLTITMFLDGVQVSTTTSSEGLFVPNFNYFDIGGDPTFGTPFAGTMSHVAMYPTALAAARIQQQSIAQKTGFVNERSDQRVGRYLRWAGVATTDQTLDTGKLTTTDHLDTTGLQLADALSQVAVTEGGLVFIGRDGKGTFHNRPHRWNVAPFVTLAPDDVGADTQFVLDNQLVVNQVTSSSKTIANLIIADQASINARGVYPVTLQVLSTNNDDVAYAAQWIVNTSSSPQPRTGGIKVDLLTSPQAVSDLFKTLEIGATFAVSGLPASSPMYGANLCVEGWKEVISTTEWSVLINTSIAIPVWKLEDPVYGVIDKTNRIAY